MSKLIPIDISGLKTIEEILDKCYLEFKITIGSKQNRPLLGEKEIFVPVEWKDDKTELFWHASSIEANPKLSVLPCNNDITSALCDKNCITSADLIFLPNADVRAKCIYRAIRIHWITEIIKMYNQEDKRVKYWEKENSDKRNRIYLRYQEEENDFLVVFEAKSSKRVRLITAFPVFYVNAKNDYENDYQKYKNR